MGNVTRILCRERKRRSIMRRHLKTRGRAQAPRRGVAIKSEADAPGRGGFRLIEPDSDCSGFIPCSAGAVSGLNSVRATPDSLGAAAPLGGLQEKACSYCDQYHFPNHLSTQYGIKKDRGPRPPENKPPWGLLRFPILRGGRFEILDIPGLAKFPQGVGLVVVTKLGLDIVLRRLPGIRCPGPVNDRRGFGLSLR